MNPAGTSAAFYKEMWTTILAGCVWHGEMVNKRKDGSLYQQEMTITPVNNAAGAITNFIAIQQDISKRKRAEEALRQTTGELSRSNQELQQFAHVASHDLQEPVRAVAGYLTLIEEGLGGSLDARGRHQMAGAIQGAERMHTLINDLLELSRVGTAAKAFQPADLNDILDAALNGLSASIKECGARISRDPLPRLNVDATQIAQLLQNLIGNALKFRGKLPPEIHVGAQPQAGKWLFSVRDNGIGIEPSTSSASSRFSSACTPAQSIPAPASAWPSARRSSSATAATFPSSRSRAAVQLFSLRFPAIRHDGREIAPEALRGLSHREERPMLSLVKILWTPQTQTSPRRLKSCWWKTAPATPT